MAQRVGGHLVAMEPLVKYIISITLKYIISYLHAIGNNHIIK